MLKNYVKTSIRALRKHPVFTFINVAGLAVGLACFILIMLYVQDERSFDRFNEHFDRIVRVVSVYSEDGDVRTFARSYPAIGPTLANEVAGVEETVRLQRYNTAVRHEDRVFNENAMFFAEASLLDIFSFETESGDAASLARPNTAVMTRSAADRYFGEDEAIGKQLVLGDTLNFTVSAVLADIPATSHLQFDILLSFETYKSISAAIGRNLDEIWTAGTFYTYALLSSPQALRPVQLGLPAYVERHLGDQENTGIEYALALQPIRDIHLKSDLRQELGPNGSQTQLYVFATIALFILLISCINFMNLSTARSAQRAREVGVRKALGARRFQLVHQFLSETLLVTVLALGVSLVLVAVALPFFNAFTGKSMSIDPAQNLVYLPAALGLAAIIGLFAGSYPAFLLSAFAPTRVLKGTLQIGKQRLATALRRGLVVVQFALSIGIIAGTAVAWQQLRFVQSQDLGFDQEQVVVLPFNWDGRVVERLETLKSELLANPSISSVTASGDVPGRMFTSMSYWIEGMPDEERGGTNALIVDPDFAETYGIDMVAGRDFSTDLAANLGETFILNETAVREMGFSPDEIIGKTFRMNETGPVVGVVEDFHFEGLQERVEPLVMTVWPGWFGYVSVRVNTEDVGATLAHIGNVWKAVVPELPFEHFFLDEDFARQYRAETQFGQVFAVFGLLAIFVSCLGLFGLAAFTAEQRTKEVGLRKVLGASAPNIVLLLNRDATILVTVAAVLAAPVSYLAMSRWLDSFAYHVELSWTVFILAGLAGLALMWVTVAFQSVRVARSNPVDALRYE